MIITFEELRHLKDSMPAGSIEKIAEELGIEADTVRNYFGGDHYDTNTTIPGVHFEKGSGGGLVEIQNTAILDAARRIASKQV